MSKWKQISALVRKKNLVTSTVSITQHFSSLTGETCAHHSFTSVFKFINTLYFLYFVSTFSFLHLSRFFSIYFFASFQFLSFFSLSFFLSIFLLHFSLHFYY